MTIVIDTREQLPLFIVKKGKLPKGPFTGKLKTLNPYTGELNIIIDKVNYGDYTLSGHEFEFAIERKQMSDFYAYIGRERKKTTRKMQEFSDIVNEGGWAALVIEASESDVLSGYMMSQVPPEVARGFLNSWRVRYGLHTYMSRERKMIERFVMDSMIKFYNIKKEVWKMEDLIKALNIFLKYGDPKWPFNCSPDELIVWGIDPSEVSESDIAELDKLGFFISEDNNEYFMSFKYGSC